MGCECQTKTALIQDRVSFLTVLTRYHVTVSSSCYRIVKWSSTDTALDEVVKARISHFVYLFLLGFGGQLEVWQKTLSQTVLLRKMGSGAMGPRVRTLENTESRPRDMMRTRTHPFLASHNAWTWKFLPGIVVGFLAHLWFSHNREGKVNALVQAPPPTVRFCPGCS